jgi:hypothetical protein
MKDEPGTAAYKLKPGGRRGVDLPIECLINWWGCRRGPLGVPSLYIFKGPPRSFNPRPNISVEKTYIFTVSLLAAPRLLLNCLPIFHNTAHNSPAKMAATLKLGDDLPSDITFSYIPYTPEKSDITSCGIPINYNASTGISLFFYALPLLPPSSCLAGISIISALNLSVPLLVNYS